MVLRKLSKCALLLMMGSLQVVAEPLQPPAEPPGRPPFLLPFFSLSTLSSRGLRLGRRASPFDLRARMVRRKTLSGPLRLEGAEFVLVWRWRF